MRIEETLQKAFNDTVGEVLCYLDEANCGSGHKKAIKTAIYELLDNKIKPLLEGLGNGNYDDRYNR